MNILNYKSKKCMCCGYENEFGVIASSVEAEDYDLDGRPVSLARDFIEYEVERCINCNYAAKDISKIIEFNDYVMRTDNYFKMVNSTLPELVKSFILASMITESMDKNKEAADFMLHACWALDDEEIDAKKYRIVTAKLFERINPTTEIKLIIIDLYRRAEEYGVAKKRIIEAKKSVRKEDMKKLFEFENVLVDICDFKCHSRKELKKYLDDSSNNELKCDTMKELERKLFIGEDDEPLFIRVRDDIIEFKKVSLVSINIEEKTRAFAILTCDELSDDESMGVFELFGNEDLEKIEQVKDKDVIDKVYDSYFESLDPNNY